MADCDEALLPGLTVSRETMARLTLLTEHLAKWNKAVNLVSKGTIPQAWSRHVLDSAQIFPHGQAAGHWVDIGSGGGFPGLVVAILAAEKAPAMTVTLVDSDQRKAVFLRDACQTLGLTAVVLSERAEVMAPLAADIVSARALAPLTLLCQIAHRHLDDGGKAIFLKGRSAAVEIAEARTKWRFVADSYVSKTDPAAVVLVIKELADV